MSERPKKHAEQERERIERKEDQVVIDSDESFPASDPAELDTGEWRRFWQGPQEEKAGVTGCALLKLHIEQLFRVAGKDLPAVRV